MVAVAGRSTSALVVKAAMFVSTDLSTPDGSARMTEAVLATDSRPDVIVDSGDVWDLPDGDRADRFGGSGGGRLQTLDLEVVTVGAGRTGSRGS